MSRFSPKPKKEDRRKAVDAGLEQMREEDDAIVAELLAIDARDHDDFDE